MTDDLRTAILDALMERWREDMIAKWGNNDTSPSVREQYAFWLTQQEPSRRDHILSWLNRILPVAEPMIREAALREAAGVAQAFAVTASLELKAVQANWFAHGEVTAANVIKSCILDRIAELKGALSNGCKQLLPSDPQS